MISLLGKVSCFGGASDDGMNDSEGLAYFEKHEADKRPDLFCDDDKFNPGIPVWKRLRTSSMYCAMRFSKEFSRDTIRNTPVKITNPHTGQFVMAWPCDWGPSVDTGRLIDVSSGVMAALSLSTDDTVKVEIDAPAFFLV